jgi:hypothetical protein
MATPSLEVAAASGDAALYDKILGQLKSAKTPEEYYMRQQTLACFTDPKLIERTLEFAISPDVHSQDSPLLIGRVMVNPVAEKQAWDFIQSHWTEIEKQGGPFASAIIVQFSGAFCDPGLRDQVKEFFTHTKLYPLNAHSISHWNR